MFNDRYVILVPTKYFLIHILWYNILNKSISQSYYFLTNYTNMAVPLHAVTACTATREHAISNARNKRS